jgi:hypothetical protein
VKGGAGGGRTAVGSEVPRLKQARGQVVYGRDGEGARERKCGALPNGSCRVRVRFRSSVGENFSRTRACQFYNLFGLLCFIDMRFL